MQISELGILWDMDGVLVDTGEFHYQSWRQALSEVSIPFSRELFQRTFGMNNTTILTTQVKRQLNQPEIEQISNRKEILFRELIRGKAEPLPGVIEWLSKLHEWNVPQAVASSAPQENIDVLLDELEIRPYFQAVVSGAEIPGKPNPTIFLNAAAAIQRTPDRCLVVEDSVAGVQAASNARMRCLAVLTTNPPERLMMADRRVERLDQLSPSVVMDFFTPTTSSEI